MALKNAYMYINTNLNLPFTLSEEIDENLIYGCDDLIEDLQKDIEKYGKEQMARLYPDSLREVIIFDNYKIINDNTAENSAYIDLTLGQLLNIYKLQNSHATDNTEIDN
ncbi:hypothetical protein [uncultured Thomasclavelia sp.]|uniref:hypothetical protein n=1 Tax=uncultured Thomasclavelia sp. TaxID=3025759 RepID=UPI0025E52C3D|nr:hypothetical protein [uncultured Thomasclavelia sp.]